MSKTIKLVLFALSLLAKCHSGVNCVLFQSLTTAQRCILRVTKIVRFGDNDGYAGSPTANCCIEYIKKFEAYIITPKLELPDDVFDDNNFILMITEDTKYYVSNCYMTNDKGRLGFGFDEGKFFMHDITPNTLKRYSHLCLYLQAAEVIMFNNIKSEQLEKYLKNKTANNSPNDDMPVGSDKLEGDCLRKPCNQNLCSSPSSFFDASPKASPANSSHSSRGSEETAPSNYSCVIS